MDTSGFRGKTVRVKTARGRKNSSTRWLQRQLNDPYVAMAKEQGYRSRAAFKLIQLNEKYSFLRPGQLVVDLGAAPGGWAQVAAEMVAPDGEVIALDLKPVDPHPGVVPLTADFMSEEGLALLQDARNGRPVQAVLSDMAPNASGQPGLDHLRIMGLCEAAYDFAAKTLAAEGVFVAKVWQGGAQQELLHMLKKDFAVVRHAKPEASRKDSAEMYVVATGFRGD